MPVCRRVAIKIAYLARGDGRVLFFLYFLLASALTTAMSNDVCIVTLTPILIYFSKVQ